MEPISTAITTAKIIKGLNDLIGGNEWSYDFLPAAVDKIYEDPNFFIRAWRQGYFKDYNYRPDGFSIGDVFFTYFGLEEYKNLIKHFNLPEIELKKFSNYQSLAEDEAITIASAGITGNYTIYILFGLLALGFLFLKKVKKL